MMNLYIMKLIKDELSYDCLLGAVVLAEQPVKARQLCAAIAGDEGRLAWLNAEMTSCRRIGIAVSSLGKTPRVLLRSYQAG